MKVVDLGTQAYGPVRELQTELFRTLIEAKTKGEDDAEETILLVEHLPVYTLGLHGDEHNLLISEDLLRERGIDVVRIERGGDITFHGPGQLVVYPIIDLERRRWGVKTYVDRLEQTIIDLCADYGVEAGRVEGATGVWIGIGTPRERKICAIGIKCSRYCTMHGLAVNINTDLSYFTAINPCGFTTKGVTSLALELGRPLDLREVKSHLLRHLRTALSISE